MRKKEKPKIRISKELKDKLEKLKLCPGETYEEVIWRIPKIKSFWKNK